MTSNHPKFLVLVLCAGLAASLLGALADAAASESAWTPGANSRARLVAAGGPEPGLQPLTYRAGIEIELKGKAHTYWRQPGDAGIPPVISFAGSRNLKSADVRFPAPGRIEEGVLQVLGYRQGVLLPIEILPENPAEPVRLAMHLSYAACDRICIPAEAQATLDLTPSGARSQHAVRLAEAAAAVPERVAVGGALALSITPRQGGTKPGWMVRIERPAGPWRDMFAEGPEGWFLETRAEGDGYLLIAAEQPKEPPYPVPVTLTLAGVRNYEFRIDLPRP